MTIADITYARKFEQILKEGISDNVGLPVRTKWNDGKIAYTKALFQQAFDYNISKGVFPLSELRPHDMKKSIGEMMWIYKDQSNLIQRLKEAYGIKWWDSWECIKGWEGTIGTAYGYTISRYKMMDDLLDGMIKNPLGRRHIMNMWQLDHIKHQLNIGGLVPCAYETMWSIAQVNEPLSDLELESSDNFINTAKNKRLVFLTLNQRSQDMLATYSINPFQYTAMGMQICSHLTKHTGIYHELHNVHHFVQNLHIYDRHENIVEQMLEHFYNLAKDKDFEYDDFTRPQLRLNVVKDFYDINVSDFILPKLNSFKPKGKIEIAI